MPLVLNGTTGVQDNSGAFVRGTAVSASSTSVNFTGIPSWVKRITVVFSGVSTNGTANLLIRLNSESSGYNSQADSLDSTATSTAGFILGANQFAAANTCDGSVQIDNITGNTWISAGIVRQNSTRLAYSAGGKATSAVVSSVQVTTANGTDAFDAGTLNILFE
jgi:hypothetical protein